MDEEVLAIDIVGLLDGSIIFPRTTKREVEVEDGCLFLAVTRPRIDVQVLIRSMEKVVDREGIRLSGVGDVHTSDVMPKSRSQRIT